MRQVPECTLGCNLAPLRHSSPLAIVGALLKRLPAVAEIAKVGEAFSGLIEAAKSRF